MFIFFSRIPILGVLPLSQLHLCLTMDTTSDLAIKDSLPRAAGDPSPAEKIALASSERTESASELSRLESLHMDGSGDAPLEDCGEDAIVCLEDVSSSRELLDNHDSSEPNGKIPNRDSGIDSPSCAVDGEVFPNEDAIDEEDHYDSVTETESVSCCVTLGNKRDSTQDEDSDLDEGSGGEIHSLADAQSEVNKVSESLEQNLPNLPKLVWESLFFYCLRFLQCLKFRL